MSIVDFEQVNIGWVEALATLFKALETVKTNFRPTFFALVGLEKIRLMYFDSKNPEIENDVFGKFPRKYPRPSTVL